MPCATSAPTSTGIEEDERCRRAACLGGVKESGSGHDRSFWLVVRYWAGLLRAGWASCSAATFRPSAISAGPDPPLPCQREDPQLWFCGLPADLELARAHCRRCPLRAPLAGAIERGEPRGVWGGEMFEQGAIIARKRPRSRLAVRTPGSVPASRDGARTGAPRPVQD